MQAIRLFFSGDFNQPDPCCSFTAKAFPEFKAQLIALCQRPGASVVDVALLRRWMHQHDSYRAPIDPGSGANSA